MTATDLHDFLKTRRSVRRFRPERLPDALIERILTTAMYAPSAHNRQPWRFCAITSAEVKRCLAEAMAADFRRDLAADGVPQDRIDAQIERSQRRIQSAPLVILLCMDMNEMVSYTDGRRAAAERNMAIQSVAASGTQLLLAAHAEGLGGVWVCSPLFTPETVQNTLKLPADWEPQAMFFIGYPEETPQPRERLSLQEISIFLREGMSVE